MNIFDRLLDLQFTWRDAVDVLIVAVIIYYTLALIRGTRAMQISIGLMLLISMVFIARAFDLPTLEAISSQVLFYLPFAVIVLFQQEIRRALAGMAANPLSVLFKPTSQHLRGEIIASACRALSAKKTGALIAIERRQSLRAYEESGKRVDAVLSTELLVTIFTLGGPLHDGSVIVRGNRLVAANVFLPLTATPDPSLAHGTRHRAALGLSEETDAVVVIVSEENGSIAVAEEGALRENLTVESLLELLGQSGGGR
jgi:diadenylate cyclase